jgi:WD40 repeat protein
MTGGPQPGPGADSRAAAKVFVSYSRRDGAFADRIDAALRAQGFDPLIDRADIYAFEDWWRRIEALIGQADTMVFVVSPSSIASSVCKREIAAAAALNKRLAPIVCQPVADALLPPELARLNFIFFDDESRFDDSATRLVEALNTDIDWVRRHTEFGEMARRWDTAGQPRGLLLRSPVLEEAERWIAARPRGAPLPTELTRTYLLASRHNAIRSRNLLVGGLSFGLVVALILSAAAIWFGLDSRRQRNVAEERNLTLTAAASRRQIESHDSLTAMIGLSDALQRHGPGPLPSEVVAATHLALWTNREVARRKLPGSVQRAWWSPDGKIRALSEGQVHVFDADLAEQAIVQPESPEGLPTLPGLIPFQLSDGELVVTPKPGAPALRLKPEDRSASVLAVARNGRCSLDMFRRSDTGELKTAVEQGEDVKRALCGSGAIQEEVADVYTSPDGRRQVVVGHIYGAVSLVDLPSRKSISTVSPYIRGSLCDGQGDDFAFSPDSRLLLYANCFDITETHQPTLIDSETGAVVAVLGGHAGDSGAIAFSPDGTRVITGTNGGELRLWTVAPNAYAAPGDFAVRQSDLVGETDPFTLAVTRSGRATIVDRRDGRTVVAFDARKAGLWPTSPPDGEIRFWPVVFAVTADARFAVLRIADGPLQLWSLTAGRLVKSFPAVDPGNAPAFILGAKVAAFLQPDRRGVHVIDLGDLAETRYGSSGEAWTNWSLDASGALLAALTERNLRLWRLGHSEPVHASAADARDTAYGSLLHDIEGSEAVLLATGARGLIVDRATGATIAETPAKSLEDLVVRGSGRLRLLARRDSTLGLLDPGDGSFSAFGAAAARQATAPQTTIFQSGDEIVLKTDDGEDTRIRALDPATGNERPLLKGYKATSVADGSALLTVGAEVWRLTPQPFGLRRIGTMQAPVTAVAMDRSGETAAFLLDDKRVAIVALASGNVLRLSVDTVVLPDEGTVDDGQNFVAALGDGFAACFATQCFVLRQSDGRLLAGPKMPPGLRCYEWRADAARGRFHCAGGAVLPGYYRMEAGQLAFVQVVSGPAADLVSSSRMLLTLAAAPGCPIGVVDVQGGNADLPFSGLTDLWDFDAGRSLLRLNGSVLTTMLGTRDVPGHGPLPELAIASDGDRLYDASQAQSLVALLGRAPPLRVLRAPVFCNADSLRREVDARVQRALPSVR